jgi:hypothetical protein
MDNVNIKAERSEAPPPPNYEYPTFEDYFHEIENYGFRSERFLNGYRTMDQFMVVEWLRAAFECGRKTKE